MLATFLTSSRPSTAGIPDFGAVGFRVHRSLRRVPVAAGTLHPSLATGLQGVSRLSDIDRRDLLVVPNPAAPDALERRLLLAVESPPFLLEFFQLASTCLMKTKLLVLFDELAAFSKLALL